MTALLLVDVQNDFMPGGALEVKEGDLILPVIRKLIEMPFDKIVASRDWHPADHGSFVDAEKPITTPQILWPRHCVQHSKGAEFHEDLDQSRIDLVISKGIDSTIDSYSTFFDNERKRSTLLEEYFRKEGIHTVYIAGLATDYCVKYSCLDACGLNFNTYVVVDGCRGVNLHPGDSARALSEMKKAGAHLIQSSEVDFNDV
jgi:nicotinamidase/pyrazinamidase